MSDASVRLLDFQRLHFFDSVLVANRAAKASLQKRLNQFPRQCRPELALCAMPTAKKQSVPMHNSSDASGVTVVAKVAEGAMGFGAFRSCEAS
jgi:hypothetical protein